MINGSAQEISADIICAVIVTYHPDSEFLVRLEKVARQIRQTIIVDNGSSESCLEQLRNLSNQLNADLILNARNEGLARALNIGARWAAENGYRWILTLDQDTTVLPDLVQSLVEIVREDPCSDRLAVVGCNYIHKDNGRLGVRVQTNGSVSRETCTVLTSGSLVSLDVLHAIGGFREDFLIDCVDHEYCLRARARGFRVVVSCRPLMEHGIGQFKEHRLLWKMVGTSNHRPIRRYFMARNTLLVARQYIWSDPAWIVRYVWAWIRAVVLVCLFEEQRVSKLTYTIRGCIDGLSSRTDSINQNVLIASCEL